MKRLEASSLERLEHLSPIVYASTGPEPGFVFEFDPAAGPLLGFFLMRARGALAPLITFDQGDGLSEITALRLKTFPFAFYHVSHDRLRGLRRLRFRPCEGQATFRFVAFQTRNAILVAVLHYLFNLRYQNVALVAPDAKGGGALSTLKSNIARIAKFFGDVSKGGGVRVQQGAQAMLPLLRMSLAQQALEVEARMHDVLDGRDVPLISFVVPTYNTSAAFLRDLLDSFTLQKAAYAELILSDDGSSDAGTRASLEAARARPGVRVIRNPLNRGIAATTNTGVAAARGQWVAFVDHDDVLVPGAIAVVADAILRHPNAIFFYTDELIVDAALTPIGEFCKPAYDSVLLSGLNYINHLSVFRADRLAAVGGLREDRDGSQDYDLLLRYLPGTAPGTIVHIPYLAYLWRRETDSYSMVHSERAVANARSALALAYSAGEAPVPVEPALEPTFHRVRLRAAQPLVSIVIPNRDSPALIKRIVVDLLERTAYPAKEVVIVDNGTTDPVVLDFYDSLQRAGLPIRVDIVAEPFNFARMCNRGARLAEGGAFLFLNNDIEVRPTGADWLDEMVECLGFQATGIVGAKLAYPTGKAQHNGVIVGLGDAAGHWYMDADPSEPGPMGRLLVRQTLTAVTGACMLVTRHCFEMLGGFDEANFAIAYNDIDLCVRARNAGIRTVWTPFASLIHHESASRGSDETGPQNIRFQQEMERLQQRHGTQTLLDDAFSPFYDRRYSLPTIIVPDELPALRPNRMQ